MLKRKQEKRRRKRLSGSRGKGHEEQLKADKEDLGNQADLEVRRDEEIMARRK
jgi:hypothetical protein